MKSSLSLEIPRGHVAYIKRTSHRVEVEFLPYLKKSRARQDHDNRFHEMTDAERERDASEGSAMLCAAIRNMVA